MSNPLIFTPDSAKDRATRKRMNKRPTTKDRVIVLMIVVACGVLFTWALHGFN